MKKRNIIISIGIVSTLIISIIGCSCVMTTSNREKERDTSTSSVMTTEPTTSTVENSSSTTNPSSNEESTTSENGSSADSSESETTSSNEVTSGNEVVEQETTTVAESTTKETTTSESTTKPTTTKPVQTTTKKPSQTTTKKPSQTTSSKPSKEETTTKAPSQNKWVPQYYTAGPEDDIGDGLDELRVGLQKYSSNGTQLYVVTNYTDNENGYFYVNEESFNEKNDAFEEAFLEVYDPQYNRKYGRPDMYGLCNWNIDNTKYGKLAWSYSMSSSEMAPGYDSPILYVWEEVRLINIYRAIMPKYVTNYYKYSFNANRDWSIEEYIIAYNEYYETNITLAQYQEGERLAKKYGIDFHQFIEFYQKEYDDYIASLKATE